MVDLPVTPEQFAQCWSTIRFSRLSPEAQVPDDLSKTATQFLKGAGLPWKITFQQDGETFIEFRFESLAGGLQNLAEIFYPPEGDFEFEENDLPEGLDEFWVFGEENFLNGTAFFCLSRSRDEVFRFDPEIDEAPQSINSSITNLANCLLLVVGYFTTLKGNDEQKLPSTLINEVEAVESREEVTRKDYWIELIHYLQHIEGKKLQVLL